MKNELISAMIVEDSHEARLLLEKYLADYPYICLVASAKSVDEATLAFLKHRPELIFLDVELDNRTGFEFLDNIRDLTENLKVIFTTAYDHYALQAIKHSAFDYLMKPIDPEELSKSMQRLQGQADLKEAGFLQKINFLQTSLNQNKPLKLNIKHGFVLVNPSEILYCQADWSYTDIFTTDNTRHTISMNIGSLEDELPKTMFIRANRSLILNLNYLQKVDKSKGLVFLRNGAQEITLSLTTAKIRKLEDLLDERTDE